MARSGYHRRHIAAEIEGPDRGTSAATLPVYTIPQIADYLTTGYWKDQDPDWGARSWGKSDRTHITYDISALAPGYRAIARLAFATWAEFSQLKFTEDKSGSGTAKIVFTATAGAGSHETDDAFDTNRITHATINIDPDGFVETRINSALTETFIHEIGHALGLGHAGDYNGPGGGGVLYQNDTRQFSIMSYIAQSNYGNASAINVLTPQMADIYAIIQKYGAASVRDTDTTYGFHASGLNSKTEFLYDFDNFGPVQEHGFNGIAPALTIYDSGGNDTLDVSGYFFDQRLDLRGGHWSDVGQFRDNIGIYRTSVIENAVGGDGDDSITGNAVANKINGNDGADRLSGLQGNDRLTGGAGADTFVFHADWGRDTVTDFANGADKIDLSSFHLATLDDVEAIASAAKSGDGVILNFGHGDVLTIRHLALADMDATDFVLA